MAENKREKLKRNEEKRDGRRRQKESEKRKTIYFWITN